MANSNNSNVVLERRPSSTATQVAHVSSDVSRRMICGGLAGMIAKTVTNPLERAKMLSQTGEHGMQQGKTSIVALYTRIIQQEGVLGLWAGNGVNLLRVFPAKAVVFSSNDVYQRMLKTQFKTEQLSGPLSFLAGGMSGMTASALTYPLDLARGRMAGKLANKEAAVTASTVLQSQRQYRGIVQTIKLTVQDEGFMALYKGIKPTLLGAMPYEGIKFGTVGLLEVMFPKDSTDNSTTKTPLRKMMFGGAGGVMAGLITYPNDTVRRILQLQGSRGTVSQYSGYWDCVQKTYASQGIARFYRGCFINIVRMAPNTAVQFGSYEILKQWTENLKL